MGRSAKARKRKESWSGDGASSGVVKGAARATPSRRSRRPSSTPSPKVQLSTPASPSSSEALSEIVAEIVVCTDDMDATPSATANGDGDDVSVVAEYVMALAVPLWIPFYVIWPRIVLPTYMRSCLLVDYIRLIRAAQAPGCRNPTNTATQRRARAEPGGLRVLVVHFI